MGLMDSLNLKKAKSLLEKNRHKVAGVVGKATDQVDKISKGKTSKVTSKIDNAARKFSRGSSPTTADAETDAETDNASGEDAVVEKPATSTPATDSAD